MKLDNIRNEIAVLRDKLKNVKTRLVVVESSLSKAIAHEAKLVEDATQKERNKCLILLKAFIPNGIRVFWKLMKMMLKT